MARLCSSRGQRCLGQGFAPPGGHHSSLGLSWASSALRLEAWLELAGEGPLVPLADSSFPSVPGPYDPVFCLGLLWSLHPVPNPLQGSWLLPLGNSLRVKSANCPAVVTYWAPPPPIEVRPQSLLLGPWVGPT